MAKKAVEGIVSELKRLLADKKVVLGTDRAFKLLHDKRLVKVYFSSDCSEISRERFIHQCDVFGVPYEQLSKSSEEIGVVCRKPFSISVIGVLA